MAAAAAAAAVVLALAAYRLDRRRRTFADLATSPAAAVFAGRNELVGRVWASEPVSSPGTGTPAVWWDYLVEEEWSHSRSEGGPERRWHERDRSSGKVASFEVVDDTGSVPVSLAGAVVVPRRLEPEVFWRHDWRGAFTNSADHRTGQFRAVERVVAVGDPVFVVGTARLDETTCVPVLDDDVLVSTTAEQHHTRTFGRKVGLLTLSAMGATTAAVALALSPDDPGRFTAWAPGLVLAVSMLAVAWLITMHNRLRLVAQGANRAWSLIDVQLQRRHDLIPPLVRIVAAGAGHDSSVLVDSAVGHRRTGAALGAEELADEAGVQGARLRRVMAVVERHPELGADASFLRLQRELADSESRIAAARTFYNDSLTLLRNRSQSFPGVLVARRLSLEHHDLLAAEGFERTVPAVEHAFT